MPIKGYRIQDPIVRVTMGVRAKLHGIKWALGFKSVSDVVEHLADEALAKLPDDLRRESEEHADTPQSRKLERVKAEAKRQEPTRGMANG